MKLRMRIVEVEGTIVRDQRVRWHYLVCLRCAHRYKRRRAQRRCPRCKVDSLLVFATGAAP